MNICKKKIKTTCTPIFFPIIKLIPVINLSELGLLSKYSKACGPEASWRKNGCWFHSNLSVEWEMFLLGSHIWQLGPSSWCCMERLWESTGLLEEAPTEGGLCEFTAHPTSTSFSHVWHWRYDLSLGFLLLPQCLSLAVMPLCHDGIYPLGTQNQNKFFIP